MSQRRDSHTATTKVLSANTEKGAGLFTRPACDGLDGFGPDQFICFYRGTLLSDAQAKLLSSEQKEYALETVCSTYYRGGAWRADKIAVIDGSARTETGVLRNLAGYANYAGGEAANCYFIRQGEDGEVALMAHPKLGVKANTELRVDYDSGRTREEANASKRPLYRDQLTKEFDLQDADLDSTYYMTDSPAPPSPKALAEARCTGRR